MLSHSVVSDSLEPHGLQCTRGILQARTLEWVAMPSLRGSSQSRIQTQVSHSADGFFIIKPPGKLKNTGVGSLSLLRGELPNPGMELGSSSLQADSLLADCVGDSQTRQQADNSYSVRTKSVPGNVLDAGKTI